MNNYHPTSPHDHFVRRTFDVAENTRALVKMYLLVHILDNLRRETLEP